jgi:hypothetical protein
LLEFSRTKPTKNGFYLIAFEPDYLIFRVYIHVNGDELSIGYNASDEPEIISNTALENKVLLFKREKSLKNYPTKPNHQAHKSAHKPRLLPTPL